MAGEYLVGFAGGREVVVRKAEIPVICPLIPVCDGAMDVNRFSHLCGGDNYEDCCYYLNKTPLNLNSEEAKIVVF